MYVRPSFHGPPAWHRTWVRDRKQPAGGDRRDTDRHRGRGMWSVLPSETGKDRVSPSPRKTRHERHVITHRHRRTLGSRLPQRIPSSPPRSRSAACLERAACAPAHGGAWASFTNDVCTGGGNAWQYMCAPLEVVWVEMSAFDAAFGNAPHPAFPTDTSH